MEKIELLDAYRKQQNLIRSLYRLESDLEKKKSSLNKKIKEVKAHMNALIYSETEKAQLSLFDDMDKFLIEADKFLEKFEK